MQTRVDARLRDEARRFALRFGCPSCMWFEEPTRACALAYPNEEHIDEGLDDKERVVFCKAFELL